MNDDVTFAIRQTQGNKSRFAIIPAIIDLRYDIIFKNQGRIEQIYSASPQNILTLVLVPLDHKSPPLNTLKVYTSQLSHLTPNSLYPHMALVLMPFGIDHR